MTDTQLSPARLVVALALVGGLWYAAGAPGLPRQLDEGDVQLDVTWPSTPQAQIAWGYKPGPDSASTVGAGGHWRQHLHLKPGMYVVTLSGRPIAKPVTTHDRGRKMVGSIATCTISTKEGQKSDSTPDANPGSMCAVTQVVVVSDKKGS